MIGVDGVLIRICHLRPSCGADLEDIQMTCESQQLNPAEKLGPPRYGEDELLYEVMETVRVLEYCCSSSRGIDVLISYGHHKFGSRRLLAGKFDEVANL